MMGADYGARLPDAAHAVSTYLDNPPLPHFTASNYLIYIASPLGFQPSTILPDTMGDKHDKWSTEASTLSFLLSFLL